MTNNYSSSKDSNSLNFTKSQLQLILDNFSKENSLTDLLQLTINSLLKTEREVFLNQQSGNNNKANGFRYRKFLGDKSMLAQDLREVFKVGRENYNIDQAKDKIQECIEKWGHYPHLKSALQAKTIEYYFTYLKFNPAIQDMIYTTNWIERLNRSFRKALSVRNTMPSIESCLALLSKSAMDMENRTYSYPITRFKLANFNEINSNVNSNQNINQNINQFDNPDTQN